MDFSCASFFYVSYMFLFVFPLFHLADSVNPCGNSGATSSYLLLCVLRWLLKQLCIQSYVDMMRFRLFGQNSYSLLCHLYLSLSASFSGYCDAAQECWGCFCWFLCRMFFMDIVRLKWCHTVCAAMYALWNMFWMFIVAKSEHRRSAGSNYKLRK